MKEWHELTETQKAQAVAMFEEKLSDAPNQYTYEIGITSNVISRKHK